MLERGDVTSAELVECYLTRIESLNPRLNSYITVAADQARAAAKDADARRALGGEHSRFLGVPISIKDLADTAGIVSTHGTAEWRDRVPEHDDAVIAKIRAAGFVILGKTVVPEFGPLNISEPPGYPPGRNPWNPALNCGGSSGGAAAALVSGMCPISHGSDGGGSIRNPSSWCGVFGLKPQRGRISRAAELAEHVLARRSDHADGCRRGRAARRHARGTSPATHGGRRRRRARSSTKWASIPGRFASRSIPTPAFRVTSARRPTGRPQRMPRSCWPTSATR